MRILHEIVLAVESIDHVIISADHMSKENFCVAVTRGRSGVDILTSEVERLRDSVTRSEERRSAVELEQDRIQCR